jgi:Protein of unknown function (DUF3754)
MTSDFSPESGFAGQETAAGLEKSYCRRRRERRNCGPFRTVSFHSSIRRPREQVVAEYADREHYIPIRKTDLVELLCADPQLPQADQEQFRRFCRGLVATLHCEYQARLEELKDAYAYFDPDSDTEPLEPHTAEERNAQIEGLFDHFIALLERANFKRLSHDEVAAATHKASDWGINLEVDFDVFDRLEIFARGDVVGRRTRRRWQRLMRQQEVAVPVYQRLVVILRLREHAKKTQFIDTESVYIKIFKDIPKVDLEMLLPGTRFKLTLMDQGKIVLPTVSGIALTAWKILQGAFAVALSSAYNSIAFLSLVGGTLGYGVKSFHGYLQTKQKYQLNLTQSLYYQNLDNNAGALFRLLNEAEEQEFREAVLAYFFLLTRAGAEGWKREHLDDAIEEFLEETAQIKVDFEIGDAVDKLIHFQLLEHRGDGLLCAVPLREARAALDRVWKHASHEFTVTPTTPPVGQRRMSA